jgi:hypothetical protein
MAVPEVGMKSGIELFIHGLDAWIRSNDKIKVVESI